MRAQQHRCTRRILGQRLADPGAMAEHEIALQLDRVFGIDHHALEAAETGRHAVDLFAGLDRALDEVAARLHEWPHAIGELDIGPAVRDALDQRNRQIGPVDVDEVRGKHNPYFVTQTRASAHAERITSARRRRKKMEPLQIAIDGPVASGKSTVAARLAQRMHCAFLDTGALYRAVAWLALERGASVDDERSVLALLDQEMPVIASPGPDGRAVIVAGGRELGNELFTPEVSRAVSLIAAMPGVRDRLVPAQRGFADKRSVVMAGRDIGTVILPNASIKFFLTATLDERVGRRQRELEARGLEIDGDALRAQVMRRDARDTGRDVSPLAKAPDAIEVDTTDMTFDEVVDELERLVRAATASRA